MKLSLAKTIRPIGLAKSFWTSKENIRIESAPCCGDGGACGAVDLEGEQIVAPHPRRPGRQDGADRTAFELNERRGVVLDVDVVACAALVDPLRRRRRER
jgi:hypothetical protein